MNFFGKKNDKKVRQDEPSSAPKVQEETPHQEPSPAPAGINFLIQESAATSPLQKRDPRILNPTQLGRVKDSKRLAETKLQGLEESLARLQAQSHWLRRWNELNMALVREKKRLFELGKQKAVMARESGMLERYDLFEGIHGVYQKLAVVKEQIGRDKRGLSVLEREAEAARQQLAQQEKRLAGAGDILRTATSTLLDISDRVGHAHHLTGTSETLRQETDFLAELQKSKKEETVALASLADERQREVKALEEELTRMRAKRQGMEMHESMLCHGEAILLRLRHLEDRNRRRTELQQRHQQSIKRQTQENELLGKAFAQFQDLCGKAETAEAELDMHRSYIQGQDGLMLQERALRLKGRRQMLLSALSLWKRISTGYESIEEKSRRVTQLRLDIQHLEDSVSELETEAGKQARLCKEKEYTYLLSKGQDIIQLRADLREGVSCSVCGATHHPYHSDTMLDQSKLIGQMKTDYEMLASESNARRQQLAALSTELHTAQGKLSAEEEALNAIRIRQNEDVLEWKLYAELDPTFAECSESTNLEARTALLRQFIENVSRDAQQAEQELETFTFHQSQIAGLSEELQKLEQKKSEVGVRLSELNTGLQVLTREVEQTSNRLDSVAGQFTSLYESIQQTVTIKDWYTTWQRNPDQLYEQIQKLITDWFDLEKAIAERQACLDVKQTELQGMTTLLQSLSKSASVIAKHTTDLENREGETTQEYQQLVPDRDAKTLLEKHIQNVRTARETYESERSRLDSLRQENDIMQGRHDYYKEHIARLEGEQKELSERLDLWMHAFNLQHPPVQLGELDEVFADGKDWSKIRSSLKQIGTDTLLCQAKVDDLNSRLIALDTEDGRISSPSPDVQENIAAKQETLTRQRSETMMQIARLAVSLEDHEKALSALRNSAETLAQQSQVEVKLT